MLLLLIQPCGFRVCGVASDGVPDGWLGDVVYVIQVVVHMTETYAGLWVSPGL